MIIDSPIDGRKYTIVYSLTLAVIGGLMILCHEFWAHDLAHTLTDLTGVLVAPILYSAFLYSRRYYLANCVTTFLIVAVVLYDIHENPSESLMILFIVICILMVLCEFISWSMKKQKSIESDLLFMKNALETRVELRTAELKFLNRQLTTDLEMLKRADVARQNSEEKLRALIHSIPDSILRIRCDGVCIGYKAGEGMESLSLDDSDQEFNVTDLLPEIPARMVLTAMQQALEDNQPQLLEFQYEKEGALHDFEARMVVMSDLEVLVMIRDVTERKHLEKEILDISQREQNRIGQDLHDGLGQLLTGISCLLQGLSQRIQQVSPGDVEQVHEISQLVKQAIAQSSWLARGLMPVNLEEGGLERAIRDLIEQIEQIHHIPCMYQCQSHIPIHDSALLVNLYRITQEALNNAVKHSHAKHIWIRILSDNGYLVLTVKDDGIGLPPTDQRQDGMGLRIMKHRATMMGAELDLHADPDGGTIMQCRLKEPTALVTNPSKTSSSM